MAKESQTPEKFSMEHYQNKITTFLQKTGKKPMLVKELAAKCRSNRGKGDQFDAALKDLIHTGVVVDRKRGLNLSACLGYFTAKVSRLSRTFGFAVRQDNEVSYFVPGKFLMGSMPGDLVLMHEIPSRSGEPEGEVVSVLQTNTAQLTGMIIEDEGRCFLLPDTMSKNQIRLMPDGNAPFEVGDKVLAELAYRGNRHADHKVRILMSYGSANCAASCAMSLLAVGGIPSEFPREATLEAEKLSKAGVQPADIVHRLDLRDLPIFTIDSAESKDLDDAISISRKGDGYRLGVHIADVSHYVRGNSALDKEALNRGTSVYFADRVIPMLPKALSNGICSLNPNEDRLSFSAIMDLNAEAELTHYEFHKSVICSRVKGVYKEINAILAGEESPEIAEKYADLRESITLMDELADKLIANRKRRGAPEIETTESKLILNEDGICCDVVPRTRGKSEMLIEEFMLLANESAARLAKEKKIPFVYRIHETPAPEKVERLTELLPRMGVECPQFTTIKPRHLAQILIEAKEKQNPLLPVLNVLVLRSMAKAKYAPEPVGHFGLALEDYAHFTSPIRRYPDLAIHRILSDLTAGYDAAWMEKRYTAFAVNASDRATATELRAMIAERQCEDCYKAEYMLAHIGECFDATIVSVTDFGFYVELPNTVEGLIHIHALPAGEYESDGVMTLTDHLSGKQYTMGQPIRVQCTKADVNSGNVDFALAPENE